MPAADGDIVCRCFLEDEELRLRQASIWDAVLSGAGSSGDLEALDGFINNTSIRLRLSYAGQEIELPGDVYASCWERHQLPPCTLIKLPHHGHGDALTSRLLEMLRPRYAVISVSDDRTDDCPSKKLFSFCRSLALNAFLRMQYRVSMLRISLMLPYVFGLKREFLWYRTCKKMWGEGTALNTGPQRFIRM